MHNVIVHDKLLQCQKNNSLIQAKLNIVKESRRPVLQDLDDIPTQNYQPKIIEPEISTKDYLKKVDSQVRQINKEIKVINQKAEKFEKKYNREERKKQDEKVFHKVPIIKTKQQLEYEKKVKEDKRLDDFVNKIVQKYEPYLTKPEPLKDEEVKAKNMYKQQYQQYQEKKQQVNKIEQGLSAKEKKEFNLVTKKDNWMNSQHLKSDRATLAEDYVEQIDSQKIEKEKEEIIEKIAKEKRKKQQQQLFYKLLDEKDRMDQTLLKKNFTLLVNKIFRQIDKQKTGYISKEELLSYFKNFNIFIDIFELNWQPFKEFVIKVKATRKGLLNKQEFVEIIQDKKLHVKQQEVLDRIKGLKKEDYTLPEFEVEQTPQIQDIEELKQPLQIRDGEIDYQQFEQLTQINQEYQDTYYPIYHQNLEVKKINCIFEKQEQIKEKRKLDPNFIVFNNEIGQLQEQYNKGNLEFQKNEDFIIDSQLYQFKQR